MTGWKALALAGAVLAGMACGDGPTGIPDDARALREAIAEVVGDDDPGGVVAGLQTGRAAPVLVTRGRADRENGRDIAADDEMRIGSVTKSFTVTVLLQLADEGRLRLDDPIRTHLPSLQNGDATLRQLANMTSGTFNYTEDPRFAEALFSDLGRYWPPEELLAVANANEPYFAPGGGWHYSNTSTVALGLVIERVTRRSLADEIRERLLDPLGLGGTVYPATTALPSPFARGYVRVDPAESFLDVTASNPSSSAGSGAMVSRVRDLLVWARALGTGALISPEAQAERLEMVPADCSSCPEYDAYGLGIGRIDGWIGHTGDYIGYQALALWDPETDRSISIVVNQRDFTRPEHVPQAIFLAFLRRTS